MEYGYSGKLLAIDLGERKIEEIDSIDYTKDYIGGRAMASRIAWERLNSSIDAYDPRNCIIITTGPFTGTIAPTSGRTMMSGISPRVYPKPWYTHSTLGGWFGSELKYAGYDGIIITGCAEKPVRIEIKNGKTNIVDAADLWGKGARETQLRLKETYGNRVQVLAIGQAGEKMVRFATVQHAEDNAAGHSGFGAVWGSKKLKAISVLGTRGVKIAHPEMLLDEVVRFGKFRNTPSPSVVWGADLNAKRPICSQACNFNCMVSRFAETVDGRQIPGQCIAGVWNSGGNMMKHTRYHGGGVEVPEGVNYGLCEEVTMHEECNDLGLDLWFRLVMQPWFIRCEQLGIHDIRGFPIKPNDVIWFENFMHQLAHRQGLGEIFAEDLCRAMDVLEAELPQELIKLGRTLEFGFGFPSHREGRLWDEEPLPFWVISAMMYISESRDPAIGSHQSSLSYGEFMIADKEMALQKFRPLSQKVWGNPDFLEPTFENKAPVAIWSQHMHMLIDSLPMCDFAFPQLIRSFKDAEEWKMAEDVVGDIDLDLRLFYAITGKKVDRNELFLVAERAFTLERMLLARAGRSRQMEEPLAAHFQLPCRADGTLVDKEGFMRLMDEYYTAREWDLERGWPMKELLVRLGLADVFEGLEKMEYENS